MNIEVNAEHNSASIQRLPMVDFPRKSSENDLASNKQWLKFLQIAFVVAAVALFIFARMADSGDYKSGDRSDTLQTFVHVILPWFLIPGLIGVFILILKYGAKHGVILPRDPSLPSTDAISQVHGFPVIQNIPEHVPPLDGPRQYRIEGVHKQTKMGISKYIQADSAANAKVKAELEDIVVTSVKKIQV